MRRAMMTAAALVAAAAGTGSPLAAQGAVARRVDAVADGEVRLLYATRPGTCGDGRGMIGIGHSYHADGVDGYGRWEGTRCVAGPATVRLTRRGGQLQGIRVTIAGDTSGAARVASADAAAWFAEVARTADGRIARDAVLAVSVADSGGTDALLRLAMDARSMEVRRAATFQSAQSGDARGVRLARERAEDAREDEELRRGAILALLTRDDAGAEDRAWAQGLWSRATDDKVRDMVLMALSQRGDAQDVSWVLARASDASLPTETRRQAVFWAGQGGAPIADLLATYRSVGTAAVKEHVIFALSQREGDAATDALVRIAQSDGDRDMRRKAIFWLGQRRDDRAAKFLADLVTK